MPSSTMRTSVLQATAIFTISMILNYHLEQNMFEQVLKNEGFLNMTSALDRTMPGAPRNRTRNQRTLDMGNNTTSSLNVTVSFAKPFNSTQSANSGSLESIYGWMLPREVAIFVVVSAMQYHWLIWLERLLPARPRRKDIPYQRPEKIEECEDREEEIVKRWIAQGRVKRASLNWCNTFLKWVLELTVGRLWYHVVEHVLRVLLRDAAPKSVLKEMTYHLSFNFLGTYFSANPLATLVSFVVVPAHKQIVFIVGADLVATVFFTTVVRVFAAWAVQTHFVQDFMRNITSNAMDGGFDRAARARGYRKEL